MSRAFIIGLLIFVSIGVTGCTQQDVKEDFSRFPFQITKTPYRAENVYGKDIAWADNDTVIFITSLEENGKWRRVLAEWKTDGSFKILKEQPKSLCARDGHVGYLTGKRSSNSAQRYFGPYDSEIQEYQGKTRLDVDFCRLYQYSKEGTNPEKKDSRLLIRNGNHFRALIKPETYISDGRNTDHEDGPAYYMNEKGKIKLFPFSKRDSSSFRYYDHVKRYFVNRISTFLCTEGECKDTKQWHIWSFDEDGNTKTININKKYPWFDYPIPKNPRIYGHMYRLYPTKQGDLIAIGGNPSKNVKKAGGVYLMKEGQEPIELIDGSIDKPAFSPDGCKVAIARDTYPLADDWKDRTDRLTIINLCRPQQLNE